MAKDFQQIYSPQCLRSYSTTAPFRLSSGLWSVRKALNAETAVFLLELQPAIETTSNKGTKLNAFDVIYSVTGSALTAAPSDSLKIKHFANAAAPSLTPVTVGGSSYSTAAQTGGQTYVVHRTITTPTYLNTAVSSYSLELTFPCDTNSTLDLLGVNIYYTSNP